MAGGVYLRFQVGAAGGSADHLRYISRPAAVRDGKEGVLLHNLPDAERERTFVLLRDHLIAFAWLQERIERRRGTGTRTFYHAVVGFESEMSSRNALSLVSRWVEFSFPHAQAATFLHRDTRHLHGHVWINARDITGRKLQIGYRQFRSLDEVWNDLYARAVGHAVDDHLARKNETRWAKRLGVELPPRLNYTPDRSWYHRQELRSAGHDELEKSGSGRVEPAAPDRTPNTAEPERSASRGESAAHRSTEQSHETERTADRALHEAHRLREDAQNLGSGKEIEKTQEQERER